MQYVVKERAPDITSNRKTWEVIATDQEGGYLGRITRFNTEQQARDYVPVQENITVRCARLDSNRRDFKVLINGEHRATFVKNTYRAGYTLRGADGNDIVTHAYRGGPFITQANFELVVRAGIAAGEIPTLAQIEWSRLHTEAWVENRMRDKARSDHAAQVRTQVLTEALELYLQHGPEGEYRERAQAMLDGVRKGSGWL